MCKVFLRLKELVEHSEDNSSKLEESIDSGFARFNTIIHCLKDLMKVSLARTMLEKFLRVLHPKWRAKVHEVVMEKDSEIYRGKKERVKSIVLKAKKESSDNETSTFGSDDEEYVCLEPDEWIKDSGCSKHMTGNKSLFSTYKAYDGGNVVFGSNLKGKIIGKGTISNDSLTISNPKILLLYDSTRFRVSIDVQMETEVLTTVLELGFGGGDDGAVDRDKGDVCVTVSVVVEVITMKRIRSLFVLVDQNQLLRHHFVQIAFRSYIPQKLHNKKAIANQLLVKPSSSRIKGGEGVGNLLEQPAQPKFSSKHHIETLYRFLLIPSEQILLSLLKLSCVG
ncbi:hypothetical protein Tco_0162320 [Tanacetum coccineum]